MPTDELQLVEKKVRAYYRTKHGFWSRFFCQYDRLEDEAQFRNQCRLASLYAKSGNPIQAIDEIEEAISEYPEVQKFVLLEPLSALVSYAKHSKDNKRIEKAYLTLIEKSWALRPKQLVETYFALFSFYLQKGEKAKAAAILENWTVQPSFSSLPLTDTLRVRLTLGDCYLQNREFNKADGEFQKGLEISQEKWRYRYLSPEQEKLYPRLLLTHSLLESPYPKALVSKVRTLLMKQTAIAVEKQIRFKGKDKGLNRHDETKLALSTLITCDLIDKETLPFEYERMTQDEESAVIDEAQIAPRFARKEKRDLIKDKAQESEVEGPMPEYLKLQKKLTNDWKKLGVGGYVDTIQSILRRLLFPRALPPEIAKKLNVTPPNGALFYGPPGTGKTFMATVIGKHFFDEDHVDIINGPELFNPLVGNSEAKMRGLFDKARRHPDETFVYVFDEIEALVAKRSTSDSVGATVGNRLTSTLLTVLDGAEKLNNILVIGVTNFKENLDDALIRSGRMGDHFEIGLPTYEDRLAILKVHIGPCIEAGTVTPQLDFEWLARETDGFSGADIAQLKRHAVGNMYESLFEFNSEGGVTYHHYEDISAIQVGKEAFEAALLSVKPKARQEKIDFALKSELLLFKPKREVELKAEKSKPQSLRRVNSAHF